MKKYTVEEINSMNYSQLVGIVRERNRPSGGIKTIHEVVRNSLITQDHNVLEIGSNTGFTSVNIALLTNCKVTGIDVVDESINESREYAKEQGVSDLVNFQKVDATTLPFADSTFDMVWASNVTSFIKDKHQALSEYIRVLKNRGYIAFIPIYYRETPPKEIVERVSEAISAPLNVQTKNDWIALVEEAEKTMQSSMEIVYQQDYQYLNQDHRMDEYIDHILSKDHLNSLDNEVKDAIAKKYKEHMMLFNENLKYCGYSSIIFQKRLVKDEVELFLTETV